MAWITGVDFNEIGTAEWYELHPTLTAYPFPGDTVRFRVRSIAPAPKIGTTILLLYEPPMVDAVELVAVSGQHADFATEWEVVFEPVVLQQGTHRLQIMVLQQTELGGFPSMEGVDVYFEVTDLPPPPIASFTMDALGGEAPAIINFTNMSIGQIDSWLWDFGDGQSSSEESPSHQYDYAGVYTVNLTVTGPGGSNATSATVTVTSPPSPGGGFTGLAILAGGVGLGLLLLRRNKK